MGRAHYVEELGKLMDAKSVAGHDLVHGELLIGDPGGRAKTLSDYQRLPRAASVPHEEVVLLVRSRRLHGRGAGWIDVHLLASAMAAGMRLWTADPRLDEIARELGVAHIPAPSLRS